jgi:N-methylhydantoinase A
MLDIVTIGAGGGSIGWIDQGGLLRMGPQSAGADPGPACYGRGGVLPACTDADLVLGYLDAAFFAGGRITLDPAAASRAIAEHVATPLGLTVEEAAAGMYRVINTNMAGGVRAISIKRGIDPREFPLVAAGGAGPLHASMICEELEIPLFIVPRESSIFCAAGMLTSDLQHDSVCSFVSTLAQVDWTRLDELATEMVEKGAGLLAAEGIPEERRQFTVKLDCRYVKQDHEVSFPVAIDEIRRGDGDAIATGFHREHQRLYGYSLEDDLAPIELINVRVRAVGLTEKPAFPEEPYGGADPADALKGRRPVYVPQEQVSRRVPVYDGHRTRHGHHITGPALIEQVNTTVLLTAAHDCVCDRHGSFVAYRKGHEDRLPEPLQELIP